MRRCYYYNHIVYNGWFIVVGITPRDECLHDVQSQSTKHTTHIILYFRAERVENSNWEKYEKNWIAAWFAISSSPPSRISTHKIFRFSFSRRPPLLAYTQRVIYMYIVYNIIYAIHVYGYLSTEAQTPVNPSPLSRFSPQSHSLCTLIYIVCMCVCVRVCVCLYKPSHAQFIGRSDLINGRRRRLYYTKAPVVAV